MLLSGRFAMSATSKYATLTRKILPYVPGRRHIVHVLSRLQKEQNTSNGRDLIEDFDGDLQFFVDPRGLMGQAIFWGGYHHASELAYLKNYLEPHMTFVDVGANQGEFTVVGAKCVSSGRVLAFEPEPSTYRWLQKNVRTNGFSNVECHNIGLGRADETVPLYDPSERMKTGIINEGLFSSVIVGEGRKEAVADMRLRRLDDVVRESNLDRLDFMKIDVEGGELAVLEGACESLERFRPQLILEISPKTFRTAGYAALDVEGLLKPLGYEFFMFRKVLGLIKRGRPSDVKKQGSFNILCKVPN